MQASIFGLMGLLVAFTFSGAASRFEARRSLIAEEANAIGTAYLRVDLLPVESQPLLRHDFREYVRSRLDVYQNIPDIAATKAALDRSKELQKKVWSDAVHALQGAGPSEKTLLLNSLNEMIDITTLRTVALTTHPPAAVFVMLGLTVIASSALAGYSMSSSGVRHWIFVITFVGALSAAIYTIFDYEFPRFGVIRIDPVDEVLVQTWESMK
jgi:hypothetical protein